MGVEFSAKDQQVFVRSMEDTWRAMNAQITNPIMHTVICIGGPAHLSRVSWPPEQSPEQAFRVALCNCSKNEAFVNYSGPGMKSQLYTYRGERDGPMMHYHLVHEDGENYYLYSPLDNGWWWCRVCESDVNEPCNHK